MAVTDTIAEIDNSPEAIKLAARRQYVQGLRDLAAFIETFPDVPLPYAGAHNAFVDDKSQLAAIARACGGRWAKNATDDFFFIRRAFAGGHAYEVNVSRERVCRKVVTGTRIQPAVPEREVEEFRWVCDEPLLADAEERERL